MTTQRSVPVRRRPRYTAPDVVALGAAMLGLAVSIYLTVEHYSSSKSFACPESSAINCVKVTTSKWSVIAGVPVALLGLLYFVVMTALLVAPAARREIAFLRIVGATAGMIIVLYLVYIELFEVDAICLWCTAVHVLTLIVFGAVLWRAMASSPMDDTSYSDG